jgi:hypothetical protein
MTNRLPRRGPRTSRATLATALATALAGLTLSMGACTDESASTPSPATTASAAVSVPPLHPSVDGYAAGAVEVAGGDRVQPVLVRIADVDDERRHGLMEVESLPDGVGMWFVYTEDRTGGFWMKNTLVPLDIAYVDADGVIVHVADAVPCEADPCPTYPPPSPYRNVLEVRAGYLADNGFGVGDHVRRTG